MSTYLWAKLLWGIVVVIAAAIYGFWRGWTGQANRSDNDSQPRS